PTTPVRSTTSSEARDPRRGDLDQAAVGGPAGQLVSVRELELAEHGRDVRLDGLDRDVQLRGDLLVGIAARDVAQRLALARREQVELGVDRLVGFARERVKDEPCEARREDDVAL